MLKLYIDLLCALLCALGMRTDSTKKLIKEQNFGDEQTFEFNSIEIGYKVNDCHVFEV